jgi:hypothetical protein
MKKFTPPPTPPKREEGLRKCETERIAYRSYFTLEFTFSWARSEKATF